MRGTDFFVRIPVEPVIRRRERAAHPGVPSSFLEPEPPAVISRYAAHAPFIPDLRSGALDAEPTPQEGDFHGTREGTVRHDTLAHAAWHFRGITDQASLDDFRRLVEQTPKDMSAMRIWGSLLYHVRNTMSQALHYPHWHEPNINFEEMLHAERSQQAQSIFRQHFPTELAPYITDGDEHTEAVLEDILCE